MENLQAIIEELKNFKYRLHKQEDYDRLAKNLKELKKKYVESGDQLKAKDIWCYEEILQIQIYYLNAFFQMKRHEFYEAWCSLEKCEKHLEFLENHFNMYGNNDQFSLVFIKTHIERFQSIYPPYIFQSPSLIISKTICSICGKETSLRNHCGHFLGEIYDGKRCVRFPKEFRIDHFAIVEKPHWKYRILFSTDDETGERIDNYDYSVVSYLIDILPSPFVEWNYRRTKLLYPHSTFSAFSEKDKCPCGSGEEYGDCCLKKDGVLKDHIDFYGFKPLYNPELKINFSTTPIETNKLQSNNNKDVILAGITFSEESFYIG